MLRKSSDEQMSRYDKRNWRKRRHNKGDSVLSKVFSFVMEHKLLFISIAGIIWLLTLRGAAAFWVVMIAVAVGPGIFMFVIYNLIAKAIWRR
jgi:hypothetical protein